MKIKTLEIKNIAAIEHEAIHFDQTPLSDADVYLITGETGSGKTTILDAICLALYATTPRLKQAGKSLVADNADNLAKNNPCRLMRRDTGEAYVKLTFEGIDGNVYLAEWQVQRGSTKKATNKLSDPTWSITNLTTGSTPIQAKGISDDKLKEVREAIEQAVGLTFDNFCRTTMLAQGEFTKFLKSKEEEKTQILEKITNLTQFREIGMRLYAIIGEKEKAMKNAQEAAKDTGLTPDELETLRHTIETLKAEIKTLTTEKADLDGRKKWLEDWGKLDDKVKKAEVAHHEAKLKAESNDHKAMAQTITEYDETHEVRNELKALTQNVKDIEIYGQKLDELKSAYHTLLEGILMEHQELSQKQQKIDALVAYLEVNKQNADIYAQAGTLAKQLKQIEGWRKSIADNEADKKQIQELLDKALSPALSAAQQALIEAQNAYEIAKKDEEAKQKVLEEKGLPTLRDQHNEAATLLSHITLAERSLATLKQARDDWKQKETELKEQLTRIDEQKKQLAALQTPLAEAEGIMKGKKEAMDKLELTVKEWTNELRAGLKVGDTCPVCGQTIHTQLMQEAFESLYQSAQADYQQAEQNHLTKKKEYEQLDSNIKASDNAYKRDKGKHDQDPSVRNAQLKLEDDCHVCGIETVSDDVEQQLAQLKVATQQQQHTLTGQIREAEKLEEELNVLRAASKGLHQKINDKLTQRDNAQLAKEDCERKTSVLEASIKTTRDSLSKAEDDVEKMLPKTLWDEQPEAFGKRLEEEADIYNRNVSQRQKLEAEVGKLQGIINDVKQVCKALTDKLPDWEPMTASEGHKIQDIKATAGSLEDQVKHFHTLLNNAQKEAQIHQQTVDDFLSQHAGYSLEKLKELCRYSEQDIKTRREQVQAELSALQSTDALKAQAVEESNKQLKNRPDNLSDTDTVPALTARVGELESGIGQKQLLLGGKLKEQEDDGKKKEALAVLVAQKEKAERECNAWYTLKDLADKDGTRFAKIAMSFIFDGLLNSANQYLQRLAPRYQLRSVKETLYISLEDAYQGFATRSTDSLSGGESFLVSLALALALADVGQQLSVDNLFIDEGFGSLSGAPLTHAINTLRSLHSRSGRHVGIISHIEEVKNNIPVQIQVLQSGGSSSSTIRIVPD